MSKCVPVAVLVPSCCVRLIKLQPDTLSLNPAPNKGARFIAEIFHLLLRVLGFGHSNSHEPHALTACQQQRDSINHPLDSFKITGRYALVWWNKESGYQPQQE
jgi:hypothetical protein